MQINADIVNDTSDIAYPNLAGVFSQCFVEMDTAVLLSSRARMLCERCCDIWRTVLSLWSRFLKRYASRVAKYLDVMLSRSLEEGALPDDWLLARLIAVFKSDKRELLYNYRPISLTWTSCNLLAPIGNKNVFLILEENKVLHLRQYRFLVYQHFSRIEWFHDFASSVNEKRIVNAAFQDL